MRILKEMISMRMLFVFMLFVGISNANAGITVESFKSKSSSSSSAKSTSSQPDTIESKLDYSKTMAWEDDFEQEFGFGDEICIYICPGYPPKVIGMPACKSSVYYSEPTAHLETNSLTHASLLDEDMARFGKGSVGHSNVSGSQNFSTFQGRVWGISPEGRFASSGSTKQVKESLVCDVAEAIKEEGGDWDDMTKSVISMINIIDMYMFKQENWVNRKLSSWEDDWFDNSGGSFGSLGGGGFGGGGSGKKFAEVYISEDDKDNWIRNSEKEKGVKCGLNNGSSGDSKILDSLGGDSSSLLGGISGGDKEVSSGDCIGDWGSLKPRGGIIASIGHDAGRRALVAWRAYDRASEKIVDHKKANDLKTKFNLEWPYKTERYPVGTNSNEWDAEDKKYAAAKKFKDIDFSKRGRRKFKIDGQVLTIWKDTSCGIQVCCDPHPLLDDCYKAIEPWKVKKVKRDY